MSILESATFKNEIAIELLAVYNAKRTKKTCFIFLLVWDPWNLVKVFRNSTTTLAYAVHVLGVPTNAQHVQKNNLQCTSKRADEIRSWIRIRSFHSPLLHQSTSDCLLRSAWAQDRDQPWSVILFSLNLML